MILIILQASGGWPFVARDWEPFGLAQAEPAAASDSEVTEARRAAPDLREGGVGCISAIYCGFSVHPYMGVFINRGSCLRILI